MHRTYLHLGDTQLKLHLRRLVDLELVLRHRLPLDGGGHLVTYELLYKGDGDDGVLGLEALQP